MTFDIALRPGRDRAVDALLVRLLPSGSLGPDVDDAGACVHVPEALAVTGHLAASRRVLGDLITRFLRTDGEVRTTPTVRSTLGVYRDGAAMLNAVLVLGAVRAGQWGVAQRLGRLLGDLKTTPTGACVGGVLTHGPADGAGSDGVTDLTSTVHVGLADLALGKTSLAHEAGRYVRTLWEDQAHPDALLLCRDGTGALVTLWPASVSTVHAVHAAGPGGGQGVVGAVLMLLAGLGDTPNENGWDPLALARAYGAFAQRCAPWVTRAADAAELAAGIAVSAKATGTPEAMDVVTTLLRSVLASQQSDGSFGSAGYTAMERLDATARVVIALQELMAVVGELAPVASAPTPHGYRVVLCNVPTGRAQPIADALVAERLAACVNAIPAVLSTYEWKGAVEREPEVTLVVKTTAERVSALTERLRALHPYDLPEVIALPVLGDEGNVAYLDWVRAQVQPDEWPHDS